MAWTTPGTATAGDVLTAAFWNTQVRDNMVELAPFFGAWTTYTPQIDQGANLNIATTAKAGQYLKIGRLIIVQVTATMNGAGAAGQVVVSLPSGFTYNLIGLGRTGFGHVFDASTNTRYTGMVEIVSGKIAFIGDWSGNGQWGNVPALGLAAGDQLDFTWISQCAL